MSGRQSKDMYNRKIIGRRKECERLEECLREDNAQLIIVYGRRRVGKTFLINEFFDNQFAFKLTGAFNQSRDFQLRNFAAEYRRKAAEYSRKYSEYGREASEYSCEASDYSRKASDYSRKGADNMESARMNGKQPRLSDWTEAFELLRAYLEQLPKDEKQVVFFDEMPWLDTQKSGFLPAFEWFWNDWASTQSNLVFVVCGSATSWMVDNIANNKGGLFNRHTCRLYLEPFKLFETEAYLESKNINWSRYEIAECYMVMGGIPYYLNLLSSRLSYRQNIDRLFFEKKGELWDEFGHLYQTLFSNTDNYIKVVEALSRKSSGLTRNEIVNSTGLSGNGNLTKILNDLTASGFVRVSGFYGKKTKNAIYQLADYYTAFYFRYIKDRYGKDEHFWSNTIDNPSRRAWAGFTFEQLCKDHISQIKHKLGISGVLTEESVWYTQGDEELGISGAQIDMLIERRDRVINLCEMKFSINEFMIDKAYDAVLRNKVDSFRKATNCKKTLQMTMITTYGVKKNKYSGFVQSEVTLDDLFHS
jgi:AAA+ ATPase superfamily predicted ATPase